MKSGSRNERRINAGAKCTPAYHASATSLGLVTVLSGLSPAERKDFRRLLSVYGVETSGQKLIWAAQVSLPPSTIMTNAIPWVD